jgi:hypothetical protein
MKKNRSRIVNTVEILRDYPNATRTLFDDRPRSGLSWIVITNQPVGLDRRELEQKILPTKKNQSIK